MRLEATPLLVFLELLAVVPLLTPDLLAVLLLLYFDAAADLDVFKLDLPRVLAEATLELFLDSVFLL